MTAVPANLQSNTAARTCTGSLCNYRCVRDVCAITAHLLISFWAYGLATHIFKSIKDAAEALEVNGA